MSLVGIDLIETSFGVADGCLHLRSNGGPYSMYTKPPSQPWLNQEFSSIVVSYRKHRRCCYEVCA